MTIRKVIRNFGGWNIELWKVWTIFPDSELFWKEGEIGNRGKCIISFGDGRLWQQWSEEHCLGHEVLETGQFRPTRMLPAGHDRIMGYTGPYRHTVWTRPLC